MLLGKGSGGEGEGSAVFILILSWWPKATEQVASTQRPKGSGKWALRTCSRGRGLADRGPRGCSLLAVGRTKVCVVRRSWQRGEVLFCAAWKLLFMECQLYTKYFDGHFYMSSHLVFTGMTRKI